MSDSCDGLHCNLGSGVRFASFSTVVLGKESKTENDFKLKPMKKSNPIAVGGLQESVLRLKTRDGDSNAIQ